MAILTVNQYYVLQLAILSNCNRLRFGLDYGQFIRILYGIPAKNSIHA
ncbi:MAG: hypothetical protein RJA81_2316 [Planctomycetota bacterium]|jgi:hypothetical protein